MRYKYIDISFHTAVERKVSEETQYDIVLFYGHSDKLPKLCLNGVSHDRVQRIINAYQPDLYDRLSFEISYRFRMSHKYKE